MRRFDMWQALWWAAMIGIGAVYIGGVLAMFFILTGNITFHPR